MSPKVAIKAYGHCLTDFEMGEVVSFPQIWYVGQTAKKVEGKPGAPCNNGRYYYRWYVHQTNFLTNQTLDPNRSGSF